MDVCLTVVNVVSCPVCRAVLAKHRTDLKLVAVSVSVRQLDLIHGLKLASRISGKVNVLILHTLSAIICNNVFAVIFDRNTKCLVLVRRKRSLTHLVELVALLKIGSLTVGEYLSVMDSGIVCGRNKLLVVDLALAFNLVALSGNLNREVVSLFKVTVKHSVPFIVCNTTTDFAIFLDGFLILINKGLCAKSDVFKSIKESCFAFKLLLISRLQGICQRDKRCQCIINAVLHIIACFVIPVLNTLNKVVVVLDKLLILLDSLGFPLHSIFLAPCIRILCSLLNSPKRTAYAVGNSIYTSIYALGNLILGFLHCVTYTCEPLKELIPCAFIFYINLGEVVKIYVGIKKSILIRIASGIAVRRRALNIFLLGLVIFNCFAKNICHSCLGSKFIEKFFFRFFSFSERIIFSLINTVSNITCPVLHLLGCA